jgi:hypothetical protein
MWPLKSGIRKAQEPCIAILERTGAGCEKSLNEVKSHDHSVSVGVALQRYQLSLTNCAVWRGQKSGMAQFRGCILLVKTSTIGRVNRIFRVTQSRNFQMLIMKFGDKTCFSRDLGSLSSIGRCYN